MATLTQIRAELAGMRCLSDAPSEEPVTVNGWYRNTDGTHSKIAWNDGQMRVQVTIRADADIAEYDRLDAEGFALWHAQEGVEV